MPAALLNDVAALTTWRPVTPTLLRKVAITPSLLELKPCRLPVSSPMDAGELHLGQYFNGVPDAFPPHAAQLHAAKRIHVQPEPAGLIYPQRPHLQLLGKGERLLEAAGEDGRLESEWRVIGN